MKPGWLWFARRTTAERRAILGASPAAGLTLIEVLLTVALMAILAAVLIPHISSDIPERLDAAAQVVMADLDYSRSLAVAHNSKYRVTFEAEDNRYFLTHYGENAILNALPRSPFRQNDDPPERQTTNLALLPMPKPMVRLAAVMRMQSGGQSVPDVTFYPDGGTTPPPPPAQQPYETIVWLACGRGAQCRFISIHVNPVTGLSEAGPLVGALPAAVATIATQNLAAADAALEGN